MDRNNSTIRHIRSNSFSAFTGDLRGGSGDFTLNSGVTGIGARERGWGDAGQGGYEQHDVAIRYMIY